MSPIVVTLIVIGAIALLVLQQITFDRGLRKQRQNRTGIFQYSRRTQGLILAIAVLAFIAYAIWQQPLQY